MRGVIIGIVLILVAAGGYYQFSYLPAQREAAEAARVEAEQEAARVAAEAAAKAEAEKAAAEAAAKAEAEKAAAEKAAADAAAAAAAAQPAATAAPAAGGDGLDAAMTTEGFDAARVLAAIEASNLDEMRKTTLRTLVEGARNNPALIEAAMTQVRAALGR
jgi:Tfp pilus assembly protein PilE